MTRRESRWLRFAALSFAASTAQAQTVLLSEDFENGAPNWTMEDYWHLTDASSACHDAPFPSGSHCAWYGIVSSCNYDGAITTLQELVLTTPVALPHSGAASVLEFWSRTHVEPDVQAYDFRTVRVSTNGGSNWTYLGAVEDQIQPWTLHSMNLDAYAGRSILLRFDFHAIDVERNYYLGWLVDDIVVRTIPEVFPTSCFGDASVVACPCSNTGQPGRGCQNSSAGTGGAYLSVSGTTNPDTILLKAFGELPSALTIFLQGSAIVGPLGFGDGLRCAGGALKRLYVRNAASGVATAPSHPSDPSVSQRSAALGDPLAPGSVRYYQTYYRDPDALFCPAPPGANFNSSQMRRIDW